MSGSTPDSVLLCVQGEEYTSRSFQPHSVATPCKSLLCIDVYAPDPELIEYEKSRSSWKLYCMKNRHKAHAAIIDAEFLASVPSMRLDAA